MMTRLTAVAVLAVAMSGCGAPSGTDGGSGTDAGAAPTCASYCTAIMANCLTTNAQFTTQAACLGTCSAWTQGTTGATSGNSLSCRAYHAGAAATDSAAATLHCPHAGPAGNGACGGNCEGFCTVAGSKCATQFPDAGGCATDCAAFANSTATYTATTTTGNNYSCRMYHLSVAATDSASATTHCPHTTTASAAGTCQ